MTNPIEQSARASAKDDAEAALRSWRADFVAWRKSLGSQDAAAEIIGVTQGTVSAWETGVKEPKMRFALRIARLSRGAVPLPSVVLGDEAVAPTEAA